MKLLNLIKKDKNLRCYSYCIGLKYDRSLKKTKGQWEKTDINKIADIVLEDLNRLKISCKIVDKTFIPSDCEKLLALRVSILWLGGDYYHDVDYHIIVKEHDGYWYSKFYDLPAKRLPPHIDIETWNWRDVKKRIKRNHYNSKIIYIAVKL